MVEDGVQTGGTDECNISVLDVGEIATSSCETRGVSGV